MVNYKNIRWSENSNDPNCRVFFVGNRVFRAFEEARRQETEDFLHSDLFALLQERGMLVKTWISEDIQIDNYPLIVEHERVSCIPAKMMPDTCLAGIARFHFEIDTLCRQYGYALRDVGFDNVTIRNGQYCFVDFGSFRKISNADIYAGDTLIDMVLPIVLYYRNNGYDFIASQMLDYFTWELNKSKPSYTTGFEDMIRPFLRPLIGGYRIKLARYHSISLTIHSVLMLKLIIIINRIANCMLRKPEWWRLIKVQNIYSPKKIKRWFDKLPTPLRKVEQKQNIAKNDYAACIIEALTKQVPLSKRVLLWGNYEYEDIMTLRNAYTGEIVVMSNDRTYADMLYKKVFDAKSDVVVLLSNVMISRELHALNYLKSDLLILTESVIVQTTLETHAIWAEKVASVATYMLVENQSEEKLAEAKVSDYWNYMGNINNCQLFENKLS